MLKWEKDKGESLTNTGAKNIGKSNDNVHLFKWLYELWMLFFMWDKWILFLAVSPNFKADWLWIMQMMEICGLLASREHEKKEARGRITANWHDRLLCAQRRAKIKHLNYRRVHSIRKQGAVVLKFTWLSQNLFALNVTLSCSYGWWNDIKEDNIHAIMQDNSKQASSPRFCTVNANHTWSHMCLMISH